MRGPFPLAASGEAAALASWGEPRACVQVGREPLPAWPRSFRSRVGGWRGRDSAGGLGSTDTTGRGAGPLF